MRMRGIDKLAEASLGRENWGEGRFDCRINGISSMMLMPRREVIELVDAEIRMPVDLH